MSNTQVILLLTQLIANGPQLVAAVKATFSADDEAELQKTLADLRESNQAQYETAIAALRATGAQS